MATAMEVKPYQSGDPCPKCESGKLIVVDTKVDGNYRLRYLGCRTCGHRPEDNKMVIPVQYAPPRGPRLKDR